jgi:hypothetical protein
MSEAQDRPEITKGILKLARQINGSAEPRFVSVEPRAECLPNCGAENVAAIVKLHGGRVQPGWTMREEPTAFVEGKFHVVWHRPDGGLVDVTPRKDSLTEILFLPDSEMDWRGEDVEPRRMMLYGQTCYCGSGIPFKICCGLSDD